MLDRMRTIVLLLLVVMPLQGLAVSARALCGHGSAALERSLGTVADTGHDHGAHRHADDTPSHDRAVDAVASDMSPNGVSHAGPTVPDSEAGSCAQCAACCVAAALVGSTARPVFSPPAHADFPADALTLRSRPFDGPERPPRTL